MLLTATGGHPGNDQQHAAIRRWIAPRDGTYSVTGKLKHDKEPGDGVRAQNHLADQGEKWSWTVLRFGGRDGHREVTLKKGDALDFVVDCRANENSDGFTWKVTIKMLDYNASFTEKKAASNGIRPPFQRPPGKPVKALTPWEKYAQVLLLSNEFVFVD